MLLHQGRIKQEHRLSGGIQLFVDGVFMYERKFSSPKARGIIIQEWYKAYPHIKNREHFFIVKYGV